MKIRKICEIKGKKESHESDIDMIKYSRRLIPKILVKITVLLFFIIIKNILFIQIVNLFN